MLASKCHRFTISLEREMTPTVGVGVNEGHFTLTIDASSYGNMERDTTHDASPNTLMKLNNIMRIDT
jgi:hypothetical protein